MIAVPLPWRRPLWAASPLPRTPPPRSDTLPDLIWLAAADCRAAELGDGEEELPALAELCVPHWPKPWLAPYSCRPAQQRTARAGARASCRTHRGSADRRERVGSIWMCSKPASRNCGASVRGSEGCVRCLSHAASTRCISSPSLARQDTAAQSNVPHKRAAARPQRSAHVRQRGCTSGTYSKTEPRAPDQARVRTKGRSRPLVERNVVVPFRTLPRRRTRPRWRRRRRRCRRARPPPVAR